MQERPRGRPNVAHFAVFNTQVTFASIRGAGHLAPLYRPAAAYTIMEAFQAGKPLPPAHMPWASPATETGAEFEPAFKGTLDVNEIGYKAAHHGKRFQEMARANREAYAAAATEAAVKAGARPTISTATLFRHQYPNTLGRYKAYQEQKEWK